MSSASSSYLDTPQPPEESPGCQAANAPDLSEDEPDLCDDAGGDDDDSLSENSDGANSVLNGQACSNETSTAPVRYSSGQLNFVENDLQTDAFSIPWGHTRSYANVLSDNATGVNGNSWMVRQFKGLLVVGASAPPSAATARLRTGSDGALPSRPDAGSDSKPLASRVAAAASICMVDSATASQWFTDFTDDVATDLFGGPATLTQNTAAAEIVFSTPQAPAPTPAVGFAAAGGSAGAVSSVLSGSGGSLSGSAAGLSGSGVGLPGFAGGHSGSASGSVGSVAGLIGANAGADSSMAGSPGVAAGETLPGAARVAGIVAGTPSASAAALPGIASATAGFGANAALGSVGQAVSFYDFSASSPAPVAGKLKSVTDQAGNKATPAYDDLGRMTSFVQSSNGQSSALSYTHYGSPSFAATRAMAAVTAGEEEGDGAVDGLLASATLEINGHGVRRANYAYYSGEAGGNVGDLKSVVIEQYDTGTATWNAISHKHYRYYVPGESAGFVHGLKYVVRGTAYQRMVDAGLDPETTPEAELAGYANYYFEYDSENRVTLERLQGGRKEYSFAYESNPDGPGFGDVNTWATQTIETLPDGNENRVYTNASGQTLLKIFRDTTSGGEWYTYSQYNSNFQLILTANSAAVDSVTEPTIGSTDLVVTLKADQGLIQQQIYYTDTDPGSGAVAGYLERQTVQEGTGGTAIAIRTVEYDTRVALGQTIHPLRAEAWHPLEDGSSPSRVAYAYTWLTNSAGQPTVQIQQKTTTYPVVSSGQNGSGTAAVEKRYFDASGRVTWFMNARGAITYKAYDEATGAVIQRIEDVDTSQMSDVADGWATQAGWGSHLVTDYIIDALGRVVQARGPWHEAQLRTCDPAPTAIRRVLFSAYLDVAHEVRRATGYMTGEDPAPSFRTVGAVRIVRRNAGGKVTDQIESVRACDCGPLTTEECFPQEKWSRWIQTERDFWNRRMVTQLYHRIPKHGDGEVIANFDASAFGYDSMGRWIRAVDFSGTIQRVVREARGLVVSSWTGTNDRGATADDPTGGGASGNNMVETSASEYDGGASGGDGNLTQLTQPVDGVSANDRVTGFAYDYRDRRTSVTTSDGVTTWIYVTTYDNLNRWLQKTGYQTSVSTAHRISQKRAFYDAMGRVYRREFDGVDPVTGNITNTLSSQNWFDLAANRIKANRAGSTAFTKTVFDALNRATVSYLACVPGTAGVPTGDDNDVTTDTVLEQTETTYDAGGNVILRAVRKRFDDAAGEGALQDVQTEPKARVSFAGIWPDGIGRPKALADFGTNGGAMLFRPVVAPERSDTVLVTTNHYKQDGEENAVIDPAGLETRWEKDDAGRRIRLIENFVECCPEKSRISEYAWHPSGQLQRLTLVNEETGNQTTTWIFGTTLDDSAVATNRLVRTKIYPESADRPAPLGAGQDGVYAQLQYSYNRQSQAVSFIDADGTEHDYVYDKLGRLVSDAVPTLGAGLDNSVLRIGRTYEVRGMLQTVTSYDAASGGSVVNQVALAYDAFANLTSDKQSHAGPVSSATPAVSYDYANGDANTVRRIETDYPNGNFMPYSYGDANSIDDHLSRISGITLGDDDSNIVDYTYIGAAWQALVSYTEIGVELTYKKQGSEPVGDAGDPYNGYDRFGRTVDMRWQTIADGTQLERIQYGFDRDSRRTWRRRLLTTGLDNAYAYDGLSQVTNAAVGNLNLNATAISGIPAQDEAWDYDPTGNWQGYQIQANGDFTLDQTRVHDKGNRLTQISNDSQPILLDQVGRMLQVSPDASGDWTQSLVIQWDAWSRIVKISQNGDVIGSYGYDGLTRRIAQTTGGNTVHTYYSDTWRPLEERINTGVTASA